MFPTTFKKAVVLPVLKKPSLDLTIQDIFHQISHLPFLGKDTRKVVVLQLQRNLDERDSVRFQAWSLERELH